MTTFISGVSRMKAALRGKKVIATLINENFETETTEKALALIMSALVDNPFRAMQNCTAVKQA